MKSTTQRTLKRLRDAGVVAAVAEKWNVNVRRRDGGFGIRQDLFGWIDVVVLEPGRGIIGIQTTSSGAASKHREKLLVERGDLVKLWVQCGGIAELWVWRKVRGRWQVDILSLPGADSLDVWLRT